MTLDRVLALLRELHTLELMAQHVSTFPCRHDTRDAWSHVRTAIDDRCALLRAVLLYDADAAVVQACETALALELPAADDNAIEVRTDTHVDIGSHLTDSPVTIH